MIPLKLHQGLMCTAGGEFKTPVLHVFQTRDNFNLVFYRLLLPNPHIPQLNKMKACICPLPTTCHSLCDNSPGWPQTPEICLPLPPFYSLKNKTVTLTFLFNMKIIIF